MKSCIMCNAEFEARDLDFVGRCDSCFHKFMLMPKNERPKLSIPFVPIYNGGR
jgi:DNA-directed RNA polymerase subunit RPC12/RpoP